jgi:hypothetical protein
MKNALFFLPALLFAACCAKKQEKPVIADKNLYESLEDDLWLPFDTTKVLEMMDIRLSGNEIDRLGNETIEGLSDEWDTLELTYIAFACSCPSWTLMEEYEKHPESQSSMDFPYGYYLEPATPSLKISDRLHSPTVRVIGKLYNEKGVPDEEPIGPGWPEGKKFRYYAYELVTPVVAIGPMYHTEKSEIPGKPGEAMEYTHFVIE